MNRNFGFTLAELMITTVMVGVILVIAPVVILKKSVKNPHQIKEKLYIAECNYTVSPTSGKCIYNDKDEIFKTDTNNNIKIYDLNKKSGLKYEIAIYAGGGGGGSSARGCNGAQDSIRLESLSKNDEIPSGVCESSDESCNSNSAYKGILTGYYLFQVGKGGAANGSGEPSVVCVISEEDAQKQPKQLNCSDKQIIATLQGGIPTNRSEDCENSYNNNEPGFGGSVNGKGGDGAIKLR